MFSPCSAKEADAMTTRVDPDYSASLLESSSEEQSYQGMSYSLTRICPVT